MRKFKYFLIFIFLFAAAGGIWMARRHVAEPGTGSYHPVKDIYYCPMHPSYTSDKPGDCPICNMKLVKREGALPQDAGKAELKVITLAEFKKLKPGEICLLHKCKMGTCLMSVTDDMARLGKCPHCKEDLGVIIRDFLPAGYSQVQLSVEKQKLIGIRTAPVQKKTAHKNLRLAGKITLDRELYEMEEEYLQAFQFYRRMGLGQKELSKARLRLKRSGLNDELIREIEQTGRPDKYLISRGSSKVWVYSQVYEHEIPLIKPGQEIVAETPVIPGKKFKGVLRAISEFPDLLTHTILARVLLENPGGYLKPQMDINVLFPVEMEKTELMIPEGAIFSTEEKNVVFLARPGGIFLPREVMPGKLGEEGREILSGLSAGDEVVVSGNFLIDSESRLKGALEGMGAAGKEHRHGG